MESINQLDPTKVELRIRMLGDLHVRASDGTLQSFATRKAELLFSYLIRHPRRSFYRDALVDKFFCDESVQTGRKNLRTIIWQIRSVLEPKGVAQGTYLKVNNREVGFNGNSSYWLDCHSIERLSGIADAKKLAAALELYQGDFLEGFNDEWCVSEREHLKMLYLNGVELLMNHHANQCNWQSAILLGEKLIFDDPLKEHIHRRLMRYYYCLGDRPAALVKYQSCVKVLREELDIEPMAKTMKLYRDIQNESISTEFKTHADDEKSLGQKGNDDAFDVASELKKMDAKLAMGLRLVEKLMSGRDFQSS
jgi:DNA-binding SARP family transcriptional activator